MFHPVLNDNLIVSDEACVDGLEDHDVIVVPLANKACTSPCLRARGGA